MELKDFAESNERNDRAIQMALRKTDETILSHYLTAVPTEERDIIYRNMSDRARSDMKEITQRALASTTAKQVKDAREYFLDALARAAE